MALSLRARRSRTSVGCPSQTAACLRAVSNTAMTDRIRHRVSAFVDGTLLTETPAQAFQSGNFNQVPVISGTNHDEWRIHSGPPV